MKALNIGKTILVWNKITDSQAKELTESLAKLIQICRNNEHYLDVQVPIPITLPNNSYLCIIKKRNEVLISITKNKLSKSIEYMPILNGDILYQYIDIVKSSELILNNRIDMSYKKPKSFWIEIPFSQAFESYCLSPNINPEDFIKNMEKDTLSEASKKFLRDAGFALENSDYSKELRETIREANELFTER